MSFRGYSGLTVSELEKKSQKTIKKLMKKDSSISPVGITGRVITKTWWGKAWVKNLENYADYENRLPRGRSYVRHGAVLDLKITEGNVVALVQGTGSKPYNVNIEIKSISKKIWNEIIDKCSGKIESVEELFLGKFPKALEDLFIAKGVGLFPSPDEIELQCSCLDDAMMCKHIAAVLYGIAVKLDTNPQLFFTLRGVKVEELVLETINKNTKQLLDKSKNKGHRVIENSEAFGMFGIDMDDEED